MNVSEQDAKESLASINDAMVRTRRAMIKAYGSLILVLWGAVWTVCFLGTHLFPKLSGTIFPVGASVGVAGMVILHVVGARRGPAIRNTFDRSLELRTYLLWVLIFAFTCAWIVVLRPNDGIRLNAFLFTVAMFGCIVMGLWFCIWPMVVLGLALTIAVLAGCFAIPPMYYAVWMALTVGGGLLGTGLYMHFKK
jgi:hypothetical protein